MTCDPLTRSSLPSLCSPDPAAPPAVLPAGFSLLELLLVLVISAALAGAAWFSLMPWWHRVQAEQEAAEIHSALREAQLLALLQHRTYGLALHDHQLGLRWTQDGSEQFLPWTTLSAEASLTATRWPSFSPFGFAQSGTLTYQTPTHEIKLVVSLFGRIRQEPSVSR